MERVSHIASDIPLVRSLIGADWRESSDQIDVVEPYQRRTVARACAASPVDVHDAVSAAVSAKSVAAGPGYERAALLRRVQALISDRGEAFALAITSDTGKPIRDSRTEVRRAGETLGFCADEATRIEGEHVPLDGSELGAGKLAMLLRFPVGVVGAIVPFNAPVNMACHKIGPAIAAGNAVILKAPPEAPRCIELLGQLFLDAGAAPGVLNIVHGGAPVGEALVRDIRVNFISFTGSTRAGLAVKVAAGLRRTTLELGGLGPNVVHADADIERAALMCATNGTRLAGQSCVSVQNLFVHHKVLDAFLAPFLRAMTSMRVGNPMDPETDVGPLISESAAQRVESWVNEARSAGAQVLCGGRRTGAFYEPTAVTNVTPQMKIVCAEIFGPVIVVRPYLELDEVISWINESGFGLNCGLFTDSTRTTMRAVREIRCGGIIVNGTSTFRPDQTPYGGIGLSGSGREGPARAVKDMTDERLVIVNY